MLLLIHIFSMDEEDQKSLQEEINQTQFYSEDRFYFRKGVKGESKLLYVHQTKSQQRLLSRYGDELMCLDATYKTTAYTLPLFFLAVKTNVDYQVCFILELLNNVACTCLHVRLCISFCQQLIPTRNISVC